MAVVIELHTLRLTPLKNSNRVTMNTTTQFTKELFNGGQRVLHFACPFYAVKRYAITHAAVCITRHEEASSKSVCTVHGRFLTQYQQVLPFHN